MNPPISADAPLRPAPARARRTDIRRDGDTDGGHGRSRPAHAAHARPVLDDDDLLLDLTSDRDADPGHADHGAARSENAPSAVLDDVVVVFDESGIGEHRETAEPLVGARAAARTKRRRHTGGDVPADDVAITRPAGLAVDAVPLDGHGALAAPEEPRSVADGDPLAMIHSIDAAWTAASCWVRRHATVQLAGPCLVLVTVGLVAVIGTSGALQRLGQIVLTAALVTAGVAWAQAIGDQRRRQQDLRFRLASGNLERADLTGTVLDGFTLWGQNLRGARLSGCSADHVLLSGADLREASLTGSSLRVASLAGADLSGARLYRSDLRGADLTGAIAGGASFELAVLRGALLEGADLSGADLTGADLRGASHDERTCWDGVVVSDDTHLPEDLPQLRS